MNREELLKNAKPILFNTEMVQAILEGRKTVTRRNPFKFEMKDGYNPDWSGYSLGEYYTGHIDSGVCLYSRGAHDVWGVRSNVVKPKYKVGEILYVRETFCENRGKYYYLADSKCGGKRGELDCPTNIERHVTCELCEDYDAWIKWRPSLHMPKTAARIFLKVTDVRVEKLQNITDKEAEKEGVIVETNNSGVMHKIKFIDLWNSTINPKDSEKYEWLNNPWVWVIEFERVEVEI